jgi:4'-phosphopantetheinyl transferase EntD
MNGSDDSALQSTPADLAGLVSTARGILPPSSALEACRISACDQEPLPQEVPYIARAVKKRRQEFVAGRSCARSALAKLGFTAGAIRVGPSREPIWPEGVVGSITHDGDYCLAAAERSDHLRGIGIDLTESVELDLDLIDMICATEERASAAALADRQMVPFKTIFCIKESVYKCLFPLVRQFFDVRDVAVELDPRTQSASVRLLNRQLFGRMEAHLRCAFRTWNGYTFSAVWLP